MRTSGIWPPDADIISTRVSATLEKSVNTSAIPQHLAETLADPRAYADERLHDAYRWLRQNNPLGVATPKGFDPFWVVTRHADIREISLNADLFPYGDRASMLTDRVNDARTRQLTGGAPGLLRTLVQMDAPDHSKFRRLTQGWFMPANVKKLESHIRTIARTTIDRMSACGDRCDFVADVALRYPLHVIMGILGLPEEDEPYLLKLTQEIFAPLDPDSKRPEVEDFAALAEGIAAVVADFERYFDRLTLSRRAHPQDDLASVIANSTVDGEPISMLDAMSYYVLIATAGHDTTSSSTAGAIWALAERPDELARVRAEPELIPGLVDEAIRWTSPVKNFMRTAARDVEIGGRTIAKGDWLMLCYASGNRDETVFADPYEFRSARKPNHHVAFGYGPHVCLGQHLAKLEMRIFFEELLPRLHSLALDGSPALSMATFVNGPKRLPISFQMR